MKPSRAALVALVAAGALALDRRASGGDSNPMSVAPVTTALPPGVWAVVDSSAITTVEVERRRKLLEILLGVPEVPAWASLHQSLIPERTVVAHLDREGFGPGSVTAKDLADARAEIESASKSAGADLDKKVREGGLADELDLQLRVSVALRKRLEKDATDAALHDTFERRKLLLCDGEVRARSLLVRSENPGLAFARATQFLAATRPDGSNFEELCRTLSDDPNAALTGGDLDFFGPRSPAIPPEVVRACFEKGEVGLVPQPVKAHDGYRVLFVTATRLLGDASFEKHKETVRTIFLAEHAATVLKSWRDEAHVVLSPDAPAQPPMPDPFPAPLGTRH